MEGGGVTIEIVKPLVTVTYSKTLGSKDENVKSVINDALKKRVTKDNSGKDKP